MSSTERNQLIIFIAAVAVRFVFNALTNFTADDAFITFRFADNLARGYGFVYNVGEHVLGTSTPLFTLLLSIFAIAKLSILTAAKVISLICSGLTAVVIYRFAKSLRLNYFVIIPAILYILWPKSISADTSGMETALFTLLVIAAFYYQHKQLTVYSIGMATLAAVTRPEGYGLLLLLLVWNIYKNPRFFMQYLIVPIIIIGPWLIFCYFYFGSLIPNTITAKIALYSRIETMSFVSKLVLLLGFHRLYGYALLVMAIPGGWWLAKKQNFGGLEIFWMVATLLVYLFSPVHLFFWYIAPIFPVYFLFTGAFFNWLGERFEMNPARLIFTRNVFAIAIVLILVAGNYRPVLAHRDSQYRLDKLHKQIGQYLYREVKKGEKVAAEDIGYIGYYSQADIIDRDGLVSPEVVPYNRDGKYLQAILDLKPAWVVAGVGSPISDFLEDTTFSNKYRLSRTFSVDRWTYRVYNRSQ